MNEQDLVRRWADLEWGSGIERARRICRRLTIAGLVLFAVVGVATVFDDIPRVALGLVGIVAGWLVAERNALRSRLAQWPTIRQYVDWPKVERDLGRSPHAQAIQPQ
jgi:hypothetical protein